MEKSNLMLKAIKMIATIERCPRDKIASESLKKQILNIINDIPYSSKEDLKVLDQNLTRINNIVEEV
jgi:hypothetical protein